MRYVSVLLSTIITVALIVVLNMQLNIGGSKTPRLGYFLSPQVGFWQNAEPANNPLNKQKSNTVIAALKGTTEVYFDERLVPHIYAENDADAYFMQGYLHAKFRLWQMEFQTHTAAGRLSEIMGDSIKGTNFLKIDKYFRRMGLPYGAERTLKMMEMNPDTKVACDAYTSGINYYIDHLNAKDIPFEYKLLDYKPEHWSNLKSALFLKMMSWDLSGGGDHDLLMTNTKNFFGTEIYKQFFPLAVDSLSPIIPKNTPFEKPSIAVKTPEHLDSTYLAPDKNAITSAPLIIPNENNGSNNWAVAGSKTKSGKPILCNDPHLGLNLPSLWYEMQITTPDYSSYGASFPGSPAIIIGFNNNIAWGVTNAGRDVKDFYEMKFKDSTMQEYWFSGAWKKSELRKDTIKVRGKPPIIQTIAITVFGPVMYDNNYKNTNRDNKYYALRWTAHDPSNEMLTFYKLNRSKNYNDYVDAVSTFQCPGQNFVFASKTGDVAIRQQGNFVAKWKRQGNFIMPGYDSTYMWQGFIPSKENPQMAILANDSSSMYYKRGFVSSANQMAVDTTYPYFLGYAGAFPPYRGYIINRKLSQMNNITIEDMQQMQTDNYNVFAEMAKPVLLKLIDESKLSADEKKYLDILKKWNTRADVNEKGATIFNLWWDGVMHETYDDEYAKSKLPVEFPDPSTLLESLLKNTNYSFANNINTKDTIETMNDVVLAAYKKRYKIFSQADKDGKLEWAKYKDTHVNHLLKIPTLSRLHLNIGGGTHIINAAGSDHGPSWRMIVQMSDEIEAYAVYPGGQSGNPGSKYYDTFVDTWAAGKYYKLLFLTKQQASNNSNIKWQLTFAKP
jgi:penicillin amidase